MDCVLLAAGQMAVVNVFRKMFTDWISVIRESHIPVLLWYKTIWYCYFNIHLKAYRNWLRLPHVAKTLKTGKALKRRRKHCTLAVVRRTNKQANKQTRPITIHCAAASVQCNLWKGVRRIPGVHGKKDLWKGEVLSPEWISDGVIDGAVGDDNELALCGMESDHLVYEKNVGVYCVACANITVHKNRDWPFT